VLQNRFDLVADVSSDDPAAIGPVLRARVHGHITETADGFHVEATLAADSARDANRELLSALRRAERRTRLRAEWDDGEQVHRFFDYVPKGVRPSRPKGGRG
jgi:hypothetical protein